MKTASTPKLITLDGEARSGKGTICHYLRKQLEADGKKVMQIDAGQVFRALVVSTMSHAVPLDDEIAIDAFLGDYSNLLETRDLIRNIYHMSRDKREALLYTQDVSANSAKIAARPGAQEFATKLIMAWLSEAGREAVDVVLLDGRALESLGRDAEEAGSVEYVFGAYFTCDPVVGARRTLGYAGISESLLSDKQRVDIGQLTAQIRERNEKDFTRKVKPVTPPDNAERVALPEMPMSYSDVRPAMVIVDTSGAMTKEVMAESFTRSVIRLLGN